jgi:acyl-CoA hydrolase
MEAETKQVKVVFPNTLNEHDTLFGGTAMQWMDEVAYITAIRLTREKMVTVSVENIKFLQPIKSGTIVEITGNVIKIRGIKIEVQVEIWVEDMFKAGKLKAVEALFIFAAVNEMNSPVRLEVSKLVN